MNRGEKIAAPRACIHRTRPIAESLKEFENMKNGVLAEEQRGTEHQGRRQKTHRVTSGRAHSLGSLPGLQ